MVKTLWEKVSPYPKNCTISTDQHQPEVVPLIVAGGKGLRMKSDTKKQYLLLNGIPVLTHTVMAFCNNEHIQKIILVVPKQDIDYCRNKILEPCELADKVHLVPGGIERQDSVYNGLKYLKKQFQFEEDPVVMIHDGVRPLISRDMIQDCIAHTIKLKACVPGLKISDTVKQVSPKVPAEQTWLVEKTMLRDHLYLIQTPQCFFLKPLVRAFEYAISTSFTGTDDASVMEHSGQAVYIIQGDKMNIKITTAEDMALAEYYASKYLKAGQNDIKMKDIL
jgi:2-C-methyl-D-erythritol 4-phosphate cytidylyltransferase